MADIFHIEGGKLVYSTAFDFCDLTKRSISVQVCDRGIPKLCSSIQEIELKPPPHQPLALCLTRDPPVLKVDIQDFDCDNPTYKIQHFGPNVNSVSVNDENNVDISTHLLNGDYFICPVACGGDGSVQYTAVGTGDIDGAAFRFGNSQDIHWLVHF